jgi:hypothetical protein
MSNLFTVDFSGNKLYDSIRGFDALHIRDGTIAITTNSKYPSKPLGNYGCEISPKNGEYHWAWGLKNVGQLTRLRQAFYLHPNGVSIPTGTGFKVIRSFYPDTSKILYTVRLGYTTGTGYWLQSAAYAANDTASYSGYFALNQQTGWNLVEVDWLAAVSGYVKLWMDGSLKETISLDTSNTRTVYAALGYGSPNSAVSGSFYLDYWRANDDGTLIGA